MKSVGDDYEQRAARWLHECGLSLLARNFRTRAGEIDIVARDGSHLVFVEVRSRSHARFAGAAASVTRRKQQRIIRAAQVYLQQHRDLAALPCRFDVVAFEPGADPGAPPRWLRGAFDSS